jgi:hypothetical protein
LEDAAIEFVSEKLYIWMPTPNDGDWYVNYSIADALVMMNIGLSFDSLFIAREIVIW